MEEVSIHSLLELYNSEGVRITFVYSRGRVPHSCAVIVYWMFFLGVGVFARGGCEDPT